jgi:WRKY transcription factor 2
MEQDNDDNNNNNNKNDTGDNEIFVSKLKGETSFDFSLKKSIAERRGFNNNVAKINTRISHFGATTPLVSPEAQSARLTIPPGISPTALLESPVMLSNPMVWL